jgi:hypothetical protein
LEAEYGPYAGIASLVTDELLFNDTSIVGKSRGSKAGKNTGLPQKNSFFCEKTALMFFFVFFALFARAMCGAGKGVLGDFLRLQRKFSPIFSEFPPLSSSVPKVLGPKSIISKSCIVIGVKFVWLYELSVYLPTYLL